MKKDDAYWEKRFEESGYRQLIVKHSKDKYLPCATFSCIGMRTKYITGRYDPYCKPCRSILNRKYREKKKCEKNIIQENIRKLYLTSS